ncbi:Copalyl diphosphate synthase [Thalictrum thalictroides]|uniref:Copalyl diphosphate synthase n=1 Tax=Thalictrum thalictroides TaxID=46969 RepID=A0A7J6WIC2_THATH|nr:Copalyl diphosphate synthase [Thalictrum thalictroides]
MSSLLPTPLCLNQAAAAASPLLLSPSFASFPTPDLPLSLFSSGVLSFGAKDKRATVGLLSSRCNATSKQGTQVYKEIKEETTPLSKWQDSENGKAFMVEDKNKLNEWIERVKSMLSSMGDGEISISAYDTAWVALVEDIHGNGGPQFPSSIEWIVNHQYDDGSWGDETIFNAHDRILNTLGCIIALKTWNIHPERCEKGLSYICQNMDRLGDENAAHMPIGFEIAFPSLIEIARKLDMEIPVDSPALQDIYAQRNLKFSKIPMDVVHKVPTTLLHSLEGMEGLDWEKLIKLQSTDGSFLFSPSSTAYALMNTKDEKCLEYLKKPVELFNGGVPNVYPVDLFEHVWAVDRLERLGISRYFQQEIEECINYVARYWTDHGIAWARNSTVCDIDDTAMGFRLLRLHGHDISPDAFKRFENNGKFVCFAGQSNQAVTGLFNVYRASQVLFPGETILENAKKFSYKFLREKQAANSLVDKWIIMKDLPGEVGYALDIPWYANLPRVESRIYLEQYGGEDDVWIGKTLYRMDYVNNNTYLELAKSDFNNCQAVHQVEWDDIQKWYTKNNLGEYGVTDKTLLRTFFVAAASIFEPERSNERIAWTKTALIVEAISSYFKDTTKEQRMDFFINNGTLDIDNNNNLRKSSWNLKSRANMLVQTLFGTILNNNNTSVANGKDMHIPLQQSFEKWLLTWQEEESDKTYGVAELLVLVISLCGGHSLSEELLSHPEYKHLVYLTNKVCYQLGCTTTTHKAKGEKNGAITNGTPMLSIDSDMQELVQTVLQKSDVVNQEIKQTFLTVVKSFFYSSYCPQETMDHHIAQVLFKRVV